jgi:alanine racemase
MLNKAIISLKILKQNALKIKRQLPNNCKFCAVVKSNAYGHGLIECANALYKIVDCYSVSNVEEGIKLRLSGIDKDILVLSPFIKTDACLAIKHNLILSVDDANDLKILNSQAKKQNSFAKIHIKINTGMNRLGIDSLEELKAFLEQLKGYKRIIVDGVYSHYSNPKKHKSLEMQTNKFLLALNLIKSYNIKVTAHISASGGFLQEKYFDMVRIGILLYGYTPFKTNKIKVNPVMKVNSVVLKTRTLKKGQTAFYGDKKTIKNQDIAIVSYGYADGLQRKCVKGIFNNRCMNLTAVNIKEKKGEHVTLMQDAEKLSKKYKTISYEVLTKCSISAEKVYRS